MGGLQELRCSMSSAEGDARSCTDSLTPTRLDIDTTEADAQTSDTVVLLSGLCSGEIVADVCASLLWQ